MSSFLPMLLDSPSAPYGQKAIHFSIDVPSLTNRYVIGIQVQSNPKSYRKE